MDPVQVAIMRIKREIPRDILEQAFLPKRYDATRKDRYFDNVSAVSIDEQIRLQVIEGRVAIDANLVGGTEMYLPLMSAELQMVDGWNMIYRFPREITGGRRIITVHELNYGYASGFYAGGSINPVNNSNLLSVARQIIRGTTGVQSLGSSYVQLVGVNTVLVNDVNQMIGDAVIRCTLAHEPNFNDIKPAYYHNFSQLAVYAAKAHVHNTLLIDLDEGAIRAGMALGRVRETVDGYADANELYYAYLSTTWTKVALMNDTEKYRKVMQLALGSKPRW